MSDELVLYTNPMSRGRIVRWMLEEVGAPYRTEVLGYQDSMKAADYLAINPMGKVPAIRHGDAVVTETAAICAYLADAFPEANLMPAAGMDRAAYYRWMFFSAGPLEAALTNRALKVVVSDEQTRMVGYGTYQRTLDTLETAIADKEFIAGDRFTAADLYVGAHIGYGLRFGGIERRPVFLSYHDRLAQRPAFLRASAIDDKLIAEMQPAQTA